MKELLMVMDEHAERVRRRLGIVRLAGWVDLLLLVALVSASLTGSRELVRILGPLHGINFLLLVTIVVTAAVDGVWSWWFPAAVFFTGGPIGALTGEWVVRRRLTRQADGVVENSAGSYTSQLPENRLREGTDHR